MSAHLLTVYLLALPWQAAALRQQLAAMNLPPDVLWVTSPLSRAIQTLLFACPSLHGDGGALPNIIVRRWAGRVSRCSARGNLD